MPEHTRSLWQAQSSKNPRPPSSDSGIPAAADVVIAGAGIAGMACALALAEHDLEVVVLDAAEPSRGAAPGTTGRSSAKVSIVHGLSAQQIARHADESMAHKYLRANQFGLDAIAERVAHDKIECGWERQVGITYVTRDNNIAKIDQEVRLFRNAGLQAEKITPELPFNAPAAISLADQAQFNPVRFVEGLIDQFRSIGGTIAHGIRVTGAKEHAGRVTITTSDGPLECQSLVVATGLPFLDRGLFFARCVPQSSYVVACEVASQPPEGMYLSADGPTRSLRTAMLDGRRLLLIGGAGHKTGQGGDTRKRYDELIEWTDANFGPCETVAQLSAHDYVTPDHRPFVGPLHPGSSRVFVTTGFNKWGFTNAVAGAELIRTAVVGESPPEWAEVYSTNRLPVSGVAELAKASVDVAAHLAGGWLDAMRNHPPPDSGEGRVRRQGVRPVAVSAKRNQRCDVSGVCPHLGGIVAWNPAERTWDCPLHGSRFDRSGNMLHGPATEDLDRR